MSEVIPVTKDNYDATVARPGIVLVDCWAPWCPACKTFAPVFEAAAGRYPNYTFAKLNTQEEKELTASLGVSHIPSLILYRDGIGLYNEPGSPGPAELEDIIRQAEQLDMEAVRRQMSQPPG